MAGNIVFRRRTVPVVVLRRRSWETWQRKILQATARPGDDPIEPPPNKVMLWPLIKGRPLVEFISDQQQPVDTTLTQTAELLRAALVRLYQLHQTEIEIDGTQLWVSHGDASVANVMFDQETQTMTWFDFDLRHDLSVSAKNRHADDLRSFLFTAVESLPPGVFSDADVTGLLNSIKPAYPRSEVWEALLRIVGDRWFECDLFHRAQLMRLRKGRGKRNTTTLIKQWLQ